ncbi:MAG: TetR/AcrR family transcriptional regulator [Rhodococcus sp. (in: high G+C Gram-positive bacteria)]
MQSQTDEKLHGNKDGRARAEPARVAGADLMLSINLNGFRSAPGPSTKGGITREQLLFAAVELFGSRGFDACSMKDLAASVGMSAPAIYNHFASKVDLLVEAVDYILSDFMKAMFVGLPTASPAETFFTIMKRQVVYRAGHYSTAQANDRLLDREFMERVMPEADRERLTAALSEYTHIIRNLLEQFAPDSDMDPALRTFAALSVANQTGTWFRAGGSLTAEEAADQCAVLIAQMLGVSELSAA